MKDSRQVVILNLDDILPNRFQPRIKFDEKAIVELSQSIKEHGVIQPIIVRKISDKYEIIAGERRYKASVMAGKTTIPAIVVELDDKESSEIALIENVQRQDLTPIEEAISYRKILDMGYLTQEQLATKLGVAQPTIANKLRLLNLDEEVQDALLDEKISERHARSLLKLTKASEQQAMLKRIISERLTVRKTDEEINKMMKDNNTSILDSIENNMPQTSIPSTNTNNENNPFILNNSVDNLNQTNNVTVDTNINNIDVNSNITTPIPNTNVEVLDFNVEEPVDPVQTENISSIPSMPIVEDIEQPTVEVSEQNNVVTPVEQFNATPIPEMNINQMEITNPVAQVEEPVQIEQENTSETPRTGRFFTMFNNEATEPENEIVNPFNYNNDVSVNNPEVATDMNINNTFNESIDNVVPSVETPNIFNQSFVNNINEPIPMQNTLENNVQDVPTNPVINNSVDSFNYASTPVVPVYEEVVPSPSIQESVPAPTVEIAEPEVSQNMTLRDVINKVRKCADEIERQNFEIDCEEFDFDDTYQIIFKIKKD